MHICTKWTSLTKHNIELQRPLWRTLDLLKIKQFKWDRCFHSFLEASKQVQDSEIVSLQSSVSKLTKADN